MEKIKTEKMNKETKEKTLEDIIDKIIHQSMKNELKYFRNNISNIIANYLFKLKEGQNEELRRNREEIAEIILMKYYPLKIELKNIKKTLLDSENIKEATNEFFEKLAITKFKDIQIDYDDKLVQYIELKQAFDFIETSINSYIAKLEEDNINLEKSLEKQYKQRVEDNLGRNERKIYILENVYKKGIPAKVIKYKIYENERRYAYDKKELLLEISPYFSNIYAILNIF